MRTEISIHDENIHKPMIPLVMALANKIMSELNIVEKINQTVRWDKSKWKVSPGILIKAVILGTFTDIRAPLNKIENKFIGLDSEFLLGDGTQLEEINQYNVGEALERLHEIDMDQLYQQIALDALHRYKISSQRLHADTTTISFYGDYDSGNTLLTEFEKLDLLKIERGYNKDHRPDCKQIVVGQIVNEHGIILATRAMNGATSDVAWNDLALEQMRQLADNGLKESLYVADSKLVTAPLISKMNEHNQRIPFLSRCPANFSNKLEARMIQKAYDDNAFEEIGTVATGKKASIYKGVSYVETVLGTPIRLLVLHSSALEAKAKVSLEKERLKLDPLLKEVQGKEFSCEADAKKELERLLHNKKMKLFEVTCEIVCRKTEKWPRGRRSQGQMPTILESYQIEISAIQAHPIASQQFLHNESCFVLISNQMEESIANRDLLMMYKEQQVVENSFRMLKDPSLASPFYLKKPERIHALSTILTIALLIRALIQYRLRSGLKKYEEQHPKEVLRISWNNKPLKSPTFLLFYDYAKPFYYEKESLQNYSFSFGSSILARNLKQLLALMSVELTELLE